jgi:hypothetical protein
MRQKRITWDDEGRLARTAYIVTRKGAHILIELWWIESSTGQRAGGIEMHSTKQLYGWDEGPSHEDCTITGGKCWHDGTSLGFSKFDETWGGSDEQAFLEAERWLSSRLADED